MTSKQERADALCWFGATGDLGHKKTFPALYDMARHGHLRVPIVGVAYSGWTLDDLKERARESIEAHGGGIHDPKAFDHLIRSLRYVDGDYEDPSTFDALRLQLDDRVLAHHHKAHRYAEQTWGPKEADALLAPDVWHAPVMNAPGIAPE